MFLSPVVEALCPLCVAILFCMFFLNVRVRLFAIVLGHVLVVGRSRTPVNSISYGEPWPLGGGRYSGKCAMLRGITSNTSGLEGAASLLPFFLLNVGPHAHLRHVQRVFVVLLFLRIHFDNH